MKFGPVPVEEADGAVLAHSAMAADPSVPESLTYKIPKGTVLNQDHLRDLRANGYTEVVVARLETGDVPEDKAAARLALAISGQGLEVGQAGRGRVNLRAEAAGIVEVNVDAITAANGIDPGITVATVPPWQRLAAGGLVATIKIIPYAVSETRLSEACALARKGLSLRSAQIASASLIETTVGHDVPTLKGRQSTSERLARFGVQLTERVLVGHREDEIANALQDAPGELLLILTASATSDIEDTAPNALRRAGGRVDHYGMPVDPGNLLFLGEFGGKPVIGLPSCARSPALNGADWVLERVICGVPVTGRDIMGMGVGGLLKEIPTRPQPRERKRGG